jgi:hypothetical protein
MNTKYIILGTLSICMLFAQSNTAEAYFTTNQSALKISEDKALYIIEYAFGLEKYDLTMPGVTKRDLLWGTNEDKIGYTFRNESGEVQKEGTVTAAVISRAPRADGMYILEKGKAQKMWLVALLETKKGAEPQNYKLQVDSLPFYVDMGAKEKDVRQLNPSELQYYVTPSVELNQKAAIIVGK